MRGMLLTLAVTLALILSIGIFSGNYSRFVSDEMQGQMRSMAELVRQGEFSRAQWMLRDLMESWQQRSDLLSMWVNHEDVDDVSCGLRQMEVSLEQQETYHALLYAAELEEALSHIYHRDALLLKNIF